MGQVFEIYVRIFHCVTVSQSARASPNRVFKRTPLTTGAILLKKLTLICSTRGNSPCKGGTGTLRCSQVAYSVLKVSTGLTLFAT